MRTKLVIILIVLLTFCMSDWLTGQPILLTPRRFLDLFDTPSAYTGETGKHLIVSAGETALEFSSITIGGGSDTEVIYNNSGALDGDSSLTWDDGAAKALTIAGASVLGLNSAVFQPTTDSVTFLQVLDADGGTPVLNVDTTNERVGIGTDSPETLLEMVSTAPYVTLHNITEEDTDGGGESRIIGKREDGAGTETAVGQIEISHDGSGVNDQLGKIVLSVNTGAGLVQALEIGSDLLATFAGSIVATNLTASRLMYSDGSKKLSSVSDLTSWVAGTTNHISVSDDGDGSVTLDLDTNTKTLLSSFNGIFLEKLDFTISEAGGTVTGSLEKDGTGDLTQRFSDGYTTLDCTPALTVNLTGYVGSDAVPKGVFVYILQSDKTTIAASNSDWPSTEHCKIAHLVLKSAATSGTDGGALVNQNVNDFASAANGQGHLSHVEERLRKEPARWDSGTALTLKNSAGTSLTTGSSSTAVEIVVATGQVYQLHRHTFPAFDMYTTGTDDAHVVNQPTDEGGAYETTVDLVSDVTHYVDGTAAGVAVGTNKYFNLVIWGIQNRSGEASHVMINLPRGQYTTSANATADADGYSVYDIPDAFEGTGFLIARLTFRLIAGSQWTYIAQEDLRGQTAPISAGVSISTTDHALLSSLDFASAGHTGFQAQGDVLDDLNTLGAVGADSEMLVGTGAGAFAWESAGTLRTSIGVGTGDSPQLTGIELGHASDTTITRTGAGAIAVEGTNVMLVGDAATAHNLLDGNVHGDSVADTVTRGSLVYGNATPKWDELTIGAADTFLGSDGTDASYRTAAQVLASLSGEAGAAFSWNSQNLTSVGTIGSGAITATGNVIANANLSVGNATTTAGVLTLLEDDDDGANFASFMVPALAANTVYTLPPDDGDNTEVLQTDGSGVLTWVAGGGGAHTHDGDTLQLDAVTSDGGAFAFTTSGLVTFSQSVTSSGGAITAGVANTTTGTLVLHDDNSANTITLTAPDVSAGSLTFTLPPTDGGAGERLQTDGAGVMTWAAAAAGNPAGADTQVQYNNGGAFGADASFNFNDGTKVLDVDGQTITGVIAIGLDMSGGTFATAVQNWPATPIIQANGTQIFKSDDTNFNLLIGDNAFQNDNGLYSIGLGYQAGYLNDTTGAGNEGNNNVYMGYQSGYGATAATNNTGFDNTAIGFRSLYKNTSGYQNIALGVSSLFNNSTGYLNVAIGSSALYANTTGIRNFALGANALLQNVDGKDNVGIGPDALYSLSEGDYNIAIGKGSLATVSTTKYNTAIGYLALGNCIGTGNIGIGAHAGLGVGGQNSTRCTFIGYDSGRLISSGDDNIFIGYKSGRNQTTLSDLLIIDNQDRGSAGAEITESLIYGVFNGTPASQSLRINGEILGADGAKIGDAGTTNYTQIATDGTVTMVGTARVTKRVDLEVMASAGNVWTYQFPYAARLLGIGDNVWAQPKVPDDWDATTDIGFIIYWYIDEARTGDNEEIQWVIDWKACPTDASESIAAPTHTGSIDYGDQLIPTVALRLTQTAVGTIATASLTAGDLIGLDFNRIVLDGGNDPTAEPAIVRIEMVWTASKLGE